MTYCPRNWIIEDTLTVKKLAFEGKSATEIGRIITKSRNSVIGYCYRQEISLIAHSGRKRMESDSFSEAIRTPSRSAISFPTSIATKRPVSSQTTLLEATPWQCRYMHGNAESLVICGEPVVTGCSWCQRHKEVVFQKANAPRSA